MSSDQLKWKKSQIQNKIKQVELYIELLNLEFFLFFSSIALFFSGQLSPSGKLTFTIILLSLYFIMLVVFKKAMKKKKLMIDQIDNELKSRGEFSLFG